MNEANQNYNDILKAKYDKFQAMLKKVEVDFNTRCHEDPREDHAVGSIRQNFNIAYRDIEKLSKIEVGTEDQYNAQMGKFNRIVGDFMYYTGNWVLATENIILPKKEKHAGEINPVFFEFRDLVSDLAKEFPSEIAERDRNKALYEKSEIRIPNCGFNNGSKQEIAFNELFDTVRTFVPGKPVEERAKEFDNFHDFCEKVNAKQIYEDTLMYCMAEDPQLCRLEVQKARKYISDIAAGNKTNEFTEDRLKNAALTIAVGERYMSELAIRAKYTNKDIDKSKRDFYIPNPVFRTAGDALLPGMEDNLDSQTYLFAIVDGIKNTINFSEIKAENGLKEMAKELNARFSENVLHPANGKLSKDLLKIQMAGSGDASILIKGDDMHYLDGTGSPEYTSMHNAYAAYIADLRTAGKDCSASIDNVKDAALDYLEKKEAIPFTTEGKQRVEAAAKIYTKAVLNAIFNGRKTDEDIVSLQREMLRNQTCRDIVMETCAKELKTFDQNYDMTKLFFFAKACNDRAANTRCENGVIVQGKAVSYKNINKITEAMESIEKDAIVFDHEEKMETLFKSTMDEYKAQHAPQVKPAEKVLNNPNNQTLNMK